MVPLVPGAGVVVVALAPGLPVVVDVTVALGVVVLVTLAVVVVVGVCATTTLTHIASINALRKAVGRRSMEIAWKQRRTISLNN